MTRKTWVIMLAMLMMSAAPGFAEKLSYVCGVAEGYPSYQFTNAQGEPIGFDVDVLRLVFQQAQKNLVIEQMKWDDVMGSLMFTEILDCSGGTEINDERKQYFDFTSPYSTRQIVIFLRADNTTIAKVEDLFDQPVTGDKQSAVELLLKKKGIRNQIRIKATESKEESMRLLKEGFFVAMIAPKEVGFYLAKQLDVNVKILDEVVEESPVGLAVKKGNTELLNLLENALQELITEGKIQQRYQEWFHHGRTIGN